MRDFDAILAEANARRAALVATITAAFAASPEILLTYRGSRNDLAIYSGDPSEPGRVRVTLLAPDALHPAFPRSARRRHFSYCEDQMNEHRLTDERIALVIEDIKRWPSQYEPPDGEELLLALVELQQHRARIAAHAAAHPEWLSEERLNLIATACIPNIDGCEKMLRLMVSELQQRRATDLTPEDIAEARRIHEWCASTSAPAGLSFESRRDIQRVIENLLRAHGATP